jgi:bacillithiol system protein YtxJ
MQDVTTPQELDALLAAPRAVLLKHGARCPISAAARDVVASLEAGDPSLTVHAVEVTGHRGLSQTVAERLGVPHESPQLFVLRDGRPAWYAEHFDITADAVSSHLAG